MQNWTKTFIQQLKVKAKGKGSISACIRNSHIAEQKLELPPELWMELSGESDDIHSTWLRSAFMAGVAVGWKEARAAQEKQAKEVAA